MRRFFRRLSRRLRSSQLDADLREEIETHRLLRRAQLERDGLTTLEAERASRQRLGPVALVRDDVHEIWFGTIDGWLYDLRQGLRGLASRSSFTAVVLVTIGLCVGANLAVFTIADALWLRPLPVAHPEQLVMVSGANDLSGTSEGFFFAEHGLRDVRRLTVFSVVAGQVATSGYQVENLPHVTLGATGREVETLAVTPEYFTLTGLKPIGRDFTSTDDVAGAPPTAILSNRLWRAAFHADAAIIGQLVDASPVRLRIIGIAPPDFRGVRLGEQTDLWIPRALVPQVNGSGMGSADPGLLAFARLAPGVTPAAADGALARDKPFMNSARVIPVRSLYGSPVGRTILVRQDAVLSIAAAIAAIVLLGGCATLVAVLFVYYERRRQELAVRLALGCSRLRLVRSLAVELVALVIGGALTALGLSWTGLHALPALSLPGGLDIGRLNLAPDWRVILVAAGAALLAIMAAAVVPLRRSTRHSLVTDLASSSLKSTPSSLRIRHAVLAGHVAASVVVLVSAGLFVRTVLFGLSAGPGFDVEHTAFADIQTRASGRPWPGVAACDAAHTDAASRYACYVAADKADRDRQAAEDEAKVGKVMADWRALPGVTGVALGRAPIGLDQAAGAAHPRPVRSSGGERVASAIFASIGAGYFDAIGVRRLAGRDLADADVRSGTADERPVLVTNSLAQALWRGEGAVGQALSMGDGLFPTGECRVIGVVSDLALGSLRQNQTAAVFAATDVNASVRPFTIHLAIHAAVAPDALVQPLERAIRVAFPNSPLASITTGRDVVTRDIGRERLGAWFFSSFGLVVLILSLAGVFGLVSYLTESRRREVGIRVALGARHAQVLWLFVSSALGPVVAGTIVGLGAAALVSKAVSSILLGVSRFDPISYAAVAALTVMSTTAAALLAAWRVRGFSANEALRAA